MITKTIPINTGIVKNSVMKRSILFSFDGKQLMAETTFRSEFPNGGKANVEQILALEEINKFRKAVL